MEIENEIDCDFLSQIRHRSLIECSSNRTAKRIIVHNSRRVDLGKIAKKLQVPSLDDFQNACSYFKKEKKLKDLEKIHMGLAVPSRQQNRTIFLESDAALYNLVGCLSGNNTKMQMHSIYCIINLGLGDEDQSLKVCKKAGSYLVTCMVTNNIMVQEICCWAFGNLCGGHPKVCSLIQSQGFEDAIQLALASHSSSVAQWGAYALNQYLNTVPLRIKAVCQPEVIKALLDSLTLHKEFIGDTAWCLFTVSTESETCSSLVNFGAVSSSMKVLLQIVEDDVLEVTTCTALVRLLTNLVAVLNEVAVEIWYHVDEFVAVVKFLMQSPYNHLHSETIQLIANVVNGVATQSITGVNVLEDSNMKRKLEPILNKKFASEFNVSQEPRFDFAS